VLGHDLEPSGFTPGEHLPACAGDEQRELDADLLAYRALARSFETDLAAVPGMRVARPLPLLGALIAMLAVHSTERALFVRCGQAIHRRRSARGYCLPCKRCGRTIRREPFMNRSSFSCPRCQPRPRTH
jgi:hypothetical protein